MIVGIDPGFNGAVAFLKNDELVIFDMPVFEFTKSGKNRKRLDTAGLHSILCMFDVSNVYIEQVNSHRMGREGAMNFGKTCGAIEGVVVACGLPLTEVVPSVWKRDMRCPKDKDGARMRASQLFPDHSEQWRLKKHDGRAEAALIAAWGRGYCERA